MDSPPPAILGKCLKPLPPGRPAVSTHNPLGSFVRQGNKCPCHMEMLVQPAFCSKPHKWKTNRRFLLLHRCNCFKSRWQLQGGGQIKLRFVFTFMWGSCKCLSSTAQESNASLQPPNPPQEHSSEAQDLNKRLPPSCISRLTLRWGKTC